MKIVDIINSSPLHLLNSVPMNSNLCYQNKRNYIIFSKKRECNMFRKLAKEKILTLDYRQYVNIEISSRFHLALYFL